MSSVSGVPDILKLRAMGARQTEVKAQLARAQMEAVTGQRADRVAATGGDTSRLMALDRILSGIDARAPMLGLAAARAGATQTALETVQAAPDGLAVQLRDAALMQAPGQRAVTGAEAGGALRQAVDALNTGIGGRSLFGGAAGDARALASADDILAEVVALLDANPGDAAAAITAVDDFFAAGGGFETLAFLGAAENAPPVDLGDERMDYAVRADADALRDMLKGLALAAAVSRSTGFGADTAQDLALLDHAGGAVAAGDEGITLLRAGLGVAEARIESAQSRDAAEKTALRIARNDMVGRDEYEAATEVAELQNRLETLYAITAKTASLSFVNFLR